MDFDDIKSCLQFIGISWDEKTPEYDFFFIYGVLWLENLHHWTMNHIAWMDRNYPLEIYMFFFHFGIISSIDTHLARWIRYTMRRHQMRHIKNRRFGSFIRRYYAYLTYLEKLGAASLYGDFIIAQVRQKILFCILTCQLNKSMTFTNLVQI